MVRCAAIILLALTGPLLTPIPAGAQAAKKPATSTRAPTTRELQRRIDDQRKLIEAQQAVVDSQQLHIQAQRDLSAGQQALLDSLTRQLADMQIRLQQLEGVMPDTSFSRSLEARLARVEQEKKDMPELPPDEVALGDFPGAFRIPGSDAAIRFSGRVRASYVLTLDPLGTDDRFLTNSIPVGDTGVAGEGRRTNFSARTSRLGTEFRTPVGEQQVRAFFEGDFAGAAGTSNAFRLRHAYAQFHGLILGQTWSTFSDPEADPQDLDFEGVNSENVIRQPLARYAWTVKPKLRAAVAAETPLISVTGGQGVNLVPDVVAALMWRYETGAHLRGAGVIRQLRVEPFALPGEVNNATGWGASLSGQVPLDPWLEHDRLVFQINGGKGVARYLNDLNSLGGSDAEVNPVTGEIEPLPVIGAYVSFQHSWRQLDFLAGRNLRSTFLYSFVTVDNLDFQPPDAYQNTQRYVVNFIFSPNNRVDLGGEYIHGMRRNKDWQRGTANQIQVVAIFRF